MVFSSGFQDPAAPRFGCEAWFHRTLPFVTTPDGTALLATDFKFVVVHADPRRLVIRGDHSCCSFLLFVLHAPCLGKTKGNGHRPIDEIIIGGKKLLKSYRHAQQQPFNGFALTPMHHLRPRNQNVLVCLMLKPPTHREECLRSSCLNMVLRFPPLFLTFTRVNPGLGRIHLVQGAGGIMCWCRCRR